MAYILLKCVIDAPKVYRTKAEVKTIGTGGGLMTRNTNIFAHLALVSIFPYRVKHSVVNGLQDVSLNFNPAVKLLLNWKSGLPALLIALFAA
jgi:hypothetical protein